MEEFQKAAVTGSWELEVARERFGPWAEERADFECLVQNPQTSSGHVRKAKKGGQMPNP